MKLGIVGHEEAKFTEETEELARAAIREAIARHKPDTIVSGGCHLGGVDIWAEEEAGDLPAIVHLPKRLTWSGGYKERNLLIARDSDLVLCVVVETLPETYKGMRFDGCYHCHDRNPAHVKSGGCWTAWKAKAREWSIIRESPSREGK